MPIEDTSSDFLTAPVVGLLAGVDGPAAVSPESHLEALLDVARDGVKTGHVVAIGECGLDFDRLQHCTRQELVARRHLACCSPVACQQRSTSLLHGRLHTGRKETADAPLDGGVQG